jgi:hypothetical protein
VLIKDMQVLMEEGRIGLKKSEGERSKKAYKKVMRKGK